RIEVFRVVPVARRMVRAIDVYDDGRAAGYDDVPYAVVSDSHAVDHPEGRIEAQPLLDDLSCEFELWNVGVSQWCVAEYLIKLSPNSFKTIGPRGQKVEKPRETIRRGFVAS